MRGHKTALALAAALLLTAAGFFLPTAVFSLTDARLADTVATFAMEPVEIRTAHQIADTFQVLSGGYSTIPVSAAYARMEEEELMEAVSAFLPVMDSAGMSSGGGDRFSLTTAETELSFCNEGDGEEVSSLLSSKVSAILWSCRLSAEDGGSLWVAVDDASGLVTSASYWPGMGETQAMSLTEKWDMVRSISDKAEEVFADYYGLPVLRVETGDYPDKVEILLETGEEETVSLELTVQGEAFSLWI